MSEIILETRTLPEPIYRRIRSDKVRLHEENGSIILTPVSVVEQAEAIKRLRGMFKSDGHAVDRYTEQKQSEKELELIPVREPNEDFWSALDSLRSKISDGRLSTENYVAQKQIDKELEG